MFHFLIRFWPVLVPLIIYLVWMWRQRRAAESRGEAVPRLRDGPLGWMLGAMILILVACFIWTGLVAEPLRGNYIAPHMENGRIVPAQVVR